MVKALWTPNTLLRPSSLAFSSSANIYLRRCYVSPTSSRSSTVSAHAPRNHVSSPYRDTALESFPTTWLLRTYFLSRLFASRWALSSGLFVMQIIANSESRFLDPDRNPILRSLIKPTVYDQFCAGRNAVEIRNCAAAVKGIGVSGVILSWAKEMELTEDRKKLARLAKTSDTEAEIREWKEGVLETLRMTNPEDQIAIKVTGAGSEVMHSLTNDEEFPTAFHDALNEICEQAKAQNTRLLVDAEQQVVQTAIDKMTIELMRTWNRGSKPVIYNTVQAYLKNSRTKITHQMQLAAAEGWGIGFKLVRGAYMGSDERSLIHDTKEDTDRSYDNIVRDLLTGEIEGITPDSLPHYEVLLSGHNSESIRKACALAAELSDQHKLKVCPEFAQLHGMADDVGCDIVQAGKEANASGSAFVPRCYKYLVWGSIKECMQYLVRRGIENRSAAEKLKVGHLRYAKELRRRFWAGLGFGR